MWQIHTLAAPSPLLIFSVPTGEVAEIAVTVTSLWEERAGRMERKSGRKQPSMSAQIILRPEATWPRGSMGG